MNKKNISEDFENLLQEIEKLFNVYISIRDYSGILFSIEGKRIFPARNYHLCPFCVKGRFSNPTWRRLCVRDCLTCSDPVVLIEKKPFIKTCWKGVQELVLPIIRCNKVMSAAYVGGFKGEIPPETNLSKKYIEMHNLLPDLPDKKTIQKLKSTITILLQGMIGTLESVVEQETELKFSRKFLITHFIQENMHKKLKLEDLAAHLFLSPSRTGHVVSILFKKTFTDILLQERMLRAKSLLLNDWNSLKNTAFSVGFNNVYYFCSSFKKFYGSSPGRFRKKLLSSHK